MRRELKKAQKGRQAKLRDRVNEKRIKLCCDVYKCLQQNRLLERESWIKKKEKNRVFKRFEVRSRERERGRGMMEA